MRTTKRFTPGVLDRYLRQERGEGIQEQYKPWHRISRSDPASRGRSHIMRWRGRQIELLSDGELVTALFSIQIPGIYDLREQFPLSLQARAHELQPYAPLPSDLTFTGTLELAKQLGIRHPAIGAKTDRVSWVMTTDQLLTIRCEKLKLLAVSCKPSGALGKRTRQLLALEKAYWQVRGVRWLLITPEIYDPRIALTLRRIFPWVLEKPCSDSDLKIATEIALQSAGLPRFLVIKRAGDELGNLDLGQRAFWQAAFFGRIPMDLSAGWRPYETLSLLSNEAFWLQNPIIAGRTAWN